MSTDAGRKDVSTKVEQKVVPDATKSTTTKAAEVTSGKADKAARDTVPDSQKSVGQATTDKISRAADTKAASAVDPKTTSSTTTTTTTTGHHGNLMGKIKDAVHHPEHALHINKSEPHVPKKI